MSSREVTGPSYQLTTVPSVFPTCCTAIEEGELEDLSICTLFTARSDSNVEAKRKAPGRQTAVGWLAQCGALLGLPDPD